MQLPALPHYAGRRLRSDYADESVGPTLHTLIGTLKRTKRLEGWYGLYKGMRPTAPSHLHFSSLIAAPAERMRNRAILITGSYPMLLFVTLVSVASVIFVGGSATRGPKGAYSVPEAGGIRMGLFTIVMTGISLPMTILINR